MNSQEMFKELGYELVTNDIDELRYEKHSSKDENEFYVIEFEDKEWQSFTVDTMDGFRIYDNQNFIKNNKQNVYQAITQQMKELGWIK